MFKHIVVALAVSGFAISASAELAPAPCQVMLHAYRACDVSATAAIATQDPVVQMATAGHFDYGSFLAAQKQAYRAQGAAAYTAAHCTNPDAQAGDIAYLQKVANIIGSMGGDPTGCADAIANLQDAAQQ